MRSRQGRPSVLSFNHWTVQIWKMSFLLQACSTTCPSGSGCLFYAQEKTALAFVVTVAVGAGTVGRMVEKPESFHEMTAEFYCGYRVMSGLQTCKLDAPV